MARVVGPTGIARIGRTRLRSGAASATACASAAVHPVHAAASERSHARRADAAGPARRCLTGPARPRRRCGRRSPIVPLSVRQSIRPRGRIRVGLRSCASTSATSSERAPPRRRMCSQRRILSEAWRLWKPRKSQPLRPRTARSPGISDRQSARAHRRQRDPARRQPDGAQGETHALMGPNGSGKSTLANVIMGHPSMS